MKIFTDRLTYAFSLSGKSKTDLWKACGISSGAVTHWFTGLAEIPNSKNLAIIADILNVNAHWLLTGEGDMRPKLPDPLTLEVIGILNQLDENDRRMFIEQGRLLLRMKNKEPLN